MTKVVILSTVALSLGLAGVFYLASSLSVFKTGDPVVEQTESTGSSSRPFTGPIAVKQVISRNGQPVGLELNNGATLRILSPTSKLYTDPGAYKAAVSNGISGFLISLHRPDWAATCAVKIEAGSDPVVCPLGGISLWTAKVEYPGFDVWLSTSADQGVSSGEVIRVRDGLNLVERAEQ